MPPGIHGPGGPKRKRDNRTFSQDSGADGPGRPSPHRPNDLPSANRGGYGQPYGQSNQQYSQQQGGGYSNAPNGQVRGGARRGGRGGGRGGGGGYPFAGNGGYAGPSNGASRGGFKGDTGNMHGDANAVPVAPTPNRPSTVNDSSTPATPVRPAEAQSSTPTTVVQSKPPLAPRPAPPQKPKPPRPVLQYDYEILTEECVHNFQDSGRDAVMASAAEAFRNEDIMAISTVFQELINAALDNKLDPSIAGECVRQIIESAPSDSMVDPSSLFLDTLSTITEPDYEYPRARPLVTSTGISSSLMREILDDQLLQSLQLVRTTFKRMFIRQQTNQLYRQSNYNLLREETEGFSKLLTELFTTSMNEPPSAEVVEDMFENIKALVGSFDLDAGRVLDVILDVFASLLVKHYRFFVKLLRTSSWWPLEQNDATSSLPPGGLPRWAEPGHHEWTLAEDERARLTEARQERDVDFWSKAKQLGMDAWFGLSGARTLSEDEVAQAVASAASSGVSADVGEKEQAARIVETQKWIQETKTLPPSGNAVASQLLGFKLQFYASSARDANDTLPVNLIYLSALLIKIGFISLRDLYIHLWPEDEAMDTVKEKQTKEKEEREAARRPGGGVLNALARAGALADDTIAAPVTRVREVDRGTTKSDPTSISATPVPETKGEEKEEQLPEPSDQKVQLLRSLLCIGAIPEALYLLGRYAWLPDLFQDLPEHLHRILHHSLGKVYDECRPLRDRDSIREAAPQVEDKQKENSLPLKANLRMHDATPTRVFRWAQLDKKDTGDGIDHMFYWDDWSDNIPICQSVDDVFLLCNTFMNYSGIKIGQDGELLLKLARIGKRSLAIDFASANKARWLDLCKRLLCPALSMTKANPGLVNEVFDILKMFDTKTRYSIYAEWFTGPTSRVPDVAASFALVTAETKDILKRMSKTNMKPMARALAKIACASPGITFAVVLNQIESYENLIDVVVDCGRYFTYMGYDVLTWCIMTTLGRAGRSRVTEDGITTSSWLSSLSLFTGKVYKRYQIMSSLPILQYVLHQLGQGNFTDLRVLRELIVSMAGIAPDTDFSEAQIQAMAGGQLLQAATLRQLQDKRHESRATAKRFMKTLVDHRLVGPLLVSIAQQRQRCIFNPDQMNLKIIGENFDDIHIGMTQFLEMVRTNLSVEEFNAVVPDVAELIFEYGLDPSIAFTLYRKSIAKAIDEYDALHPSQTRKGIRRTSSNKPPPPTGIEMTDATIPEVIEASDIIENAKDEVILASSDLSLKGEDAVIDSSPQHPWHPVLQALMDRLRPTMPEKFLSSMSLTFFTTFWQLSLHDLMAPAKSYGDEDVRQKERIAAINADRTDVTAIGARKKEQEKRAIVDFRDGLLKEMKEHMSNYTDVRSRLEQEKKHWFEDFKGQYKALNDALLQECFLPRLLISPLDSYFAWKMLNLLHSSGTPEFRTMHFLDRLLGEKMLTNLMFHCTAREAECLGRFLNEVLQELTAWHGSKVIYEKRAWGPKKELPGFTEKPASDDEPAVFVQYEDFRRLLSKWHQQLTAALMECFGGNKEYMHIKNAIVVLRCVCKYFPAINWQGTRLYTTVELLSKSEKNVRPDIWVASSSLLGNLKAREKAWVLPQAFSVVSPASMTSLHILTHLKAKQKAHTRPSTATPQPGTPSNGTVANLNATASEFVPKGLVSVHP
jgi:THO complex subunit 2